MVLLRPSEARKFSITICVTHSVSMGYSVLSFLLLTAPRPIGETLPKAHMSWDRISPKTTASRRPRTVGVGRHRPVLPGFCTK